MSEHTTTDNLSEQRQALLDRLGDQQPWCSNPPADRLYAAQEHLDNVEKVESVRVRTDTEDRPTSLRIRNADGTADTHYLKALPDKFGLVISHVFQPPGEDAEIAVHPLEAML